MDPSDKMFVDRINESISVEGVSNRIIPLLKKAKREDLLVVISKSVSEYLKSVKVYVFQIVRDIISECLVDVGPGQAE